MRAYRIASRKYPPDNSEGARIAGGRWNTVGTRVIYASTSKALAACEVLANRGGIPLDFMVIEIDIPDDVTVVEPSPISLFGSSWKTDRNKTARFGSKWVSDCSSAVLKVPSAIWQDDEQYNLILNPTHPDFARIRFRVTGEDIDPRLAS